MPQEKPRSKKKPRKLVISEAKKKMSPGIASKQPNPYTGKTHRSKKVDALKKMKKPGTPIRRTRKK